MGLRRAPLLHRTAAMRSFLALPFSTEWIYVHDRSFCMPATHLKNIFDQERATSNASRKPFGLVLPSVFVDYMAYTNSASRVSNLASAYCYSEHCDRVETTRLTCSRGVEWTELFKGLLESFRGCRRDASGCLGPPPCNTAERGTIYRDV